MIFFIYSVKIIFLFPTNMILPSCQKSKDDLPENTLKDDIFGGKDNIHLGKYGIFPDRKR